ncbi:MerC domain-containing protein [Croceicoccus sp. F390]|uniref:MerC domain-containing protein n=1 Tax=Croceicoccus esteveae TaxID=3075597 RepID=A0ABU2ZHM9_9SPHN|nr:MerC domain-containing protein [Croceicoccus sp. F390]MDT0576112.1 MerC domain-containing protein [Croceicoccus sp. F390]
MPKILSSADSRQSASPTRVRLDRYGIALSGLCAVHCLASLLLVGIFGLGGHFLLAPSIHKLGLVLAIGIGAAAIWFGVRRHGRAVPLAIGAVGIMLMAAALVGPHGVWEAVLTIWGVAVVAGAHILNLRLHALTR